MKLFRTEIELDPKGGPSELHYYLLGIRLFSREIIPNHDGTPYLVRYKLINRKKLRLFLHHFYTSDSDRDLHDHPFHFVSLVLWNGYIEWTEGTEPVAIDFVDGHMMYADLPARVGRRKWPGMLLFRKAAHRHAVELLKRPDGTERRAWTLVLLTGKVREWGFHTKDGFVHNSKYIPSYLSENEKRPPK